MTKPKTKTTTIFNTHVKGVNCPKCKLSQILHPYQRLGDMIHCIYCRSEILLDKEMDGVYNGFLFEEKK